MLFYLDPPYWGGEDDYGKGMFCRDKFTLIADALGSIEGAYVLSINDRPEVRELFAVFNFQKVSLKYTVAAGAAKQARELIITNRSTRIGFRSNIARKGPACHKHR